MNMRKYSDSNDKHTETMQFDFGENWKNFSRQALNDVRVQAARGEFEELIADIDLAGKSFLEIGFGQGLSLLFATEQGAACTGCDINEKCLTALEQSRRFFPALRSTQIQVVIGSILEPQTVHQLRKASSQGNDTEPGYDVVHSWGVLHHTGNMDTAIRNAASLVKTGGHLVIAIYNRHWSSKPWLFIKWLYVKAPRVIRKALVLSLYPVIWVAKLAVTSKSPMRQQRGMDFYYNVVDWVGGYPYEYGSREEIVAMMLPLGFTLQKFVAAEVPTGCNEFVFKRKA